MDNAILKIMRERRSIRKYKKEQITEEQLQAILEAGTYAPTGMGAQSPLILAVRQHNQHGRRSIEGIRICSHHSRIEP